MRACLTALALCSVNSLWLSACLVNFPAPTSQRDNGDNPVDPGDSDGNSGDSTTQRPEGCVVLLDGNAQSTTAADGLTWATAFHSMANALAKVTELQTLNGGSGCELWMAKGTYYVFAAAKTDTVHLKVRQNLRGGFDGELTPDERDRNARTVLSGCSGEACSGDRVFHVVIAEGHNQIDGIVIHGGDAMGAGDDARGGGLLVRGDSVKVANCIFNANRASVGGGAVFATNAMPILTDVMFFSNTVVRGSGGAILAQDCGQSLQVSKAYFYGNTAQVATPGEYAGGGAIALRSCATEAVLSDVRFAHNYSKQQGEGGALYIYDTQATVTNAVFVGNGRDIDTHQGGAVFVRSTTNSTGRSDLVMRNVVMFGNRSTHSGAMGQDGGGEVTLVHATVVGNIGNENNDSDGSGSLFAFDYHNASFIIKNSIIWNNKISKIRDELKLQPEGSLVQGWKNVGGNLTHDTDPKLVAPSLDSGIASGVCDSIEPEEGRYLKRCDTSTDLTKIAQTRPRLENLILVFGSTEDATTVPIASIEAHGAGGSSIYMHGSDVYTTGTAFTILDLRLQSDSPCRNRGITVSSLSEDLDGLLRNHEGRPDVGAFEFGAPAP